MGGISARLKTSRGEICLTYDPSLAVELACAGEILSTTETRPGDTTELALTLQGRGKVY